MKKIRPHCIADKLLLVRYKICGLFDANVVPERNFKHKKLIKRSIAKVSRVLISLKKLVFGVVRMSILLK